VRIAGRGSWVDSNALRASTRKIVFATAVVLTLTVTQGNKSVGFKEFGVEPMAIRGSAGYLAKVHLWVQVQGGDAAA